jgi:cation diffusion facilitator CzcD-associated flavoprotein CzcO
MIEADYLVVGAGATGMIFVDEMLTHSDARFVIVDRRFRCGGHWNDAYPFVRLHQPSAFYGAGSRELGSRRIETSGPNAGLFQQATGSEITAYFEQLMQERFLPSGRVQFLPLHDYRGDWGGDPGGARPSRHQAVSLATGEVTDIRVAKKVVDTTFYRISTPLTHERPACA